MFVSLATYQMAKDNYVIEENEASINVDETNNLPPKELKKSSRVNLSSSLVTTELKEKAEELVRILDKLEELNQKADKSGLKFTLNENNDIILDVNYTKETNGQV